MKRVLRTLWIGSLALALSGCGLFGGNKPSLSGTIEADEWPVVAEVGGTVTRVIAKEGSTVKKGEVLAEIDQRSYQISVAEAKAALEQAKAKLEEAKAGSRDQTIQKGVAAVQQANANIRLAQARSSQAEAGIARASQQLAQVEAQREGAEETLHFQQKRLQEVTALYEKGAISQKDLDMQKEAVNQATTQLNQWTAQVAQVKAAYSSAEEEATAAAAQIGTAKAQEQGAQAELDLAREGSTVYTIRALLAAQEQAQARLDQAMLQLDKTRVVAVEDGVLLRSSVEQGEVAKTGATLFTMMKADQLKLVVYIPEAQLNRVQKGQEVGIQVDAYPNETFKGTISRISEKAEFTPKNVQTQDERTKLVFAVTIDVAKGQEKIKPGMPADVLLPEGENAQ
ncbi:multidrug transporter [Brevibacillus parabrevis]|uniref:HlyD family secretion protein n=1 Tax=Brevibacillus parabrevis TaxID=54914 RepID=UPI0007AB5C1B|nr:HlyD family efflux transporter periplasmic adaptor subunit [Brevibacillus parabrevis]KZE44654.1 multidrug transporter [Brevibacillus parabrevis]